MPSPEILAVDDLLTHRLDAPAFASPRRDQRRVRALLLVTLPSNMYILLFVERCSLHADMVSITPAEVTVDGTANVFINRHMPLWGCPRITFSDNGLQFCSKHSHPVYQILGARKLATGAYHAYSNGGERVNHKTASLGIKIIGMRNFLS